MLNSVEVKEEATGTALPFPFSLHVNISGGFGDTGESAKLREPLNPVKILYLPNNFQQC
jgi:hypothetical protein